MGEKIEVLSKGKILNSIFEIELNHPVVRGQDNQIHVQSNDVRLEIDEKDFLKYAFSILVAEKNLKNMKKIK
jgi:hypothetical protein